MNQLFKESIPRELAERLVATFGLKGFNDTNMFCKDTINIEKIDNMLEEMRQYYLPCKAKIYLCRGRALSHITVLRQIVRLFGKTLKSVQKYVNKKKITFYYLEEEMKGTRQLKQTQEMVTVDFS